MKDNEIFVRVRKGNRVIEDMALSAAKENIHRGWKIEDIRYDEYGRKVEAEPSQKLSVLIDANKVKSEMEKGDFFGNPVPEVNSSISESDNTEEIASISRMRSKKKLQEIIDGDEPQDFKEAAQERLNELNK